jgi:excisionase family DNA binding protein
MKKSTVRALKETMAVPLLERPTLTVGEFCRLIGIGRSTAYKAMKAGDLKPSKYGKRTLIKREEMLRFVESM